MRRRKHPLSGAMYDVREDGLVEVSLDGHTGLFTSEGDHVEGDLRHADPHLCLWLAGPQVPAHLARNPKDLPSIARQRATAGAVAT
ncbi:MAG: hypothetical protein WEB78_04205 [Ilumatobacteraceae bacterium]